MNITGHLIKAIFIERSNRYLSLIQLDNHIIEAFIPNPGRMKELLIKGVSVLIKEAGHIYRKTAYDLMAVHYNNEWVCIDSRIPNKIINNLLLKKSLKEFTKYINIKSEAKYLSSRFDFFLSGCGKGCFIEAKSCTLVENGIALFPDAPTKRGTKHLYELIHAVKEGYEAYVIIVIQRGDANIFMPNKLMDPEFATAMKNAIENQVNVIAISTILCDNEIRFNNRVEVTL